MVLTSINSPKIPTYFVSQAEEKQTTNAHSVVVDGKIKFRTHLSHDEKAVVKRAATGVSAEFGVSPL